MIPNFASGLPVFASVAITVVLVGGALVFYALRIKGDVFAELSHGKTTLRFDARDKRGGKKL